MERMVKKVALIGITTMAFIVTSSQACSRVICKEPHGDRVITARSMDWKHNVPTSLWIFPRGMEKSGENDNKGIKWTSKYGSVVAVLFNGSTTDGINEKGLVANMLWEGQADYGDSDKPKLSLAALAQYVLDNYKDVNEAVESLGEDFFQVTTVQLPDNKITLPKGTPIPIPKILPSQKPFKVLSEPVTIELPTLLHLAISDASGDSAIIEFIEGKMVIHHSKDYKVVTNSPTFDKQLAINGYWESVGGNAMLPGTHRPAERFVRGSFYTNNPVKGKQGEMFKNSERLAVAKAFSIIREVSVPIGVSIPSINIPPLPKALSFIDKSKPFDLIPASSTVWRTVSDQKALKYYFDSAVSPSIFWVDLKEVDLNKGAAVKKLELENHPILSGEVSNKFVNAKPFRLLE